MGRKEVPRFPVSVKAVIYNPEKDAILLIEKTKSGKTAYGLPGGLKELGESIEDTLRREVMEELGVNVEPLHLIHAVNYRHPSGAENVGLYYLARLRGGKIRLGSEPDQQFKRVVWLTEQNIEEKIQEEKYKQFLKDILKRAKQLYRVLQAKD